LSGRRIVDRAIAHRQPENSPGVEGIFCLLFFAQWSLWHVECENKSAFALVCIRFIAIVFLL